MMGNDIWWSQFNIRCGSCHSQCSCVSKITSLSRLAMAAWSQNVAGGMMLKYMVLYKWHIIMGIIAL